MSLENVLGAFIGGVAGFFLGGGSPIAALKGAIYGAALGSLFVDTELPPGPKLDNTKANISEYGQACSRIYGKDVVSGTIIWMKGNQLEEKTRKETKKNKLLGFTVSKTTQKFTDYYATFAVELCEGPIKQVLKIWANDEVIYETGSGNHKSLAAGDASIFKWNSAYFGVVEGIPFSLDGEPLAEDDSSPTIRIYHGTLEQQQDPAIVAEHGSTAPAWRSKAYVVFDRMLVSTPEYGNQIPQLKFLVEKTDTSALTSDDTNPSMFLENLNLQGIDGNIQPGCHFPIHSTLAKYKYGYNNSVSGQYIEVPHGSLGVHAIDNQMVYTSWCIGASFEAFEIEDPFGNSNETFYKSVAWTYTNSDAITRAIHTGRAFPIYRWSTRVDQLATIDGIEVTTPIINEDTAWLYPFDFPSKTSFSSYVKPYVELANAHKGSFYIKPILNSRDMYLIIWTRGTSSLSSSEVLVSIGKLINGRMSIYTLDGLNIDEGNSLWSTAMTKVTWAESFDFGLETLANSINCMLYRGNVYVTCRRNEDSRIAWFPGTIIVPVEELSWNIMPFEKRDSLAQYLTQFYRHDGSNYAIRSRDTKKVNKQFITNWIWNKNYQYDSFAPCYESGNLYGFHRNPYYVDSSKTLIPTINAQTLYGVFKINPDTGDMIEDLGAVTIELITEGSATSSVVAWRNGYGFPQLLRMIDDKYFILPWGSWDTINSEYAWLGWPENTTPTNNSNDPDGSLFVPTSSYWSTANGNYNLFPVVHTNNYADHIYGFMASSDVVYLPGSNVTGPRPTQDYNWLRKFRFYKSKDIESYRTDETVTAQDVLEAEIERTGLLSVSDLDFSAVTSDVVSGLTIAEASNVGSIVSALQTAFLFDVYEEDNMLKVSKREGASIYRVIPYTDLEAGETGEKVIDFKPTVPINYRAASRYTVSYRDSENEYTPNTVSLDNPYSDDNVTTNLTIPLVMTAQEALQVLDRSARSTESIKQGSGEFQLTFKHSDLEIGKFVQVGLYDGTTYVVRIVNIDKGLPGIVKVTGQIDRPENYSSSRQLTISGTAVVPEVRSPIPILIDSLPFAGVDDNPGFWVGTANLGGSANSNARAAVYISYDDGASYQGIASVSGQASIAFCTSVLTNGTWIGIFDYSQNLDLRIMAGNNFNTVTEAQAIANERTNTYFYGRDGRWEIIKILNFTDNLDGTFTASGILRGYKGTQHYMGNHETGDYLISANTALVRYNANSADIGKYVKLAYAIPGLPAAYSIEVGTVLGGLGRQPLTPINIVGSRNSSGDLIINWVRQTRYGIKWVNKSDAALDEEIEEYRVFILNPASNDVVVRTLEVTNAKTITYTAAMQTTDFGSIQTTVKVAIGQYSRTLADVGNLGVTTL